MTTISEEIENMRKGLIDFGTGNRLLFYKNSSRGIEIIEEDPQEIFDKLVLGQMEMDFVPFNKINLNTPVNLNVLINTPYDKTNLEEKVLKLFKYSSQLQKNLGFSFLYIALGFIDYSTTTESYKAPLVLIPINIKKIKNTSKYRVSWTEEKIITNLSLQVKLERELGIRLPNIEYSLEESGNDSHPAIKEYYVNVKEVIRDQPTWSISEEMVVDFFDFRKILMYTDLNSANWSGENILASQTLGMIDYDSSGLDYITDTDLDQVLDPKDTYPILDADSSQLAIIEHTKKGGSIIVEGPPGTGKSQTIANIITELLGQHKSILFVSAKMAALNVVKNRLDTAGFGEFCLELHSEKSTQNSIYSQIQNSIIYETLDDSSIIPSSNDRVRTSHVDQLRKYRDSLNNYAKAIRQPIEGLDKNPIYFIGIKEKALQLFDNANIPFPYIPIKGSGNITASQWQEAKDALSSFATVYSKVIPIEENPWLGIMADQLFEDQKLQLKYSLSNVQNLFEYLVKEVKELGSSLEITYKEEFSEISKICEIIHSILITPVNDSPISLFKSFSAFEARETEEKLEQLISEFERFQINNSDIINDGMWDLPVDAVIKKYDSLIAHLNEQVSQYSLDKGKITIHDFEELYRQIETISALINSIQGKSTQLSSYYKNFWSNEDSNPEELEEIAIIYREILTNASLFKGIPDTLLPQVIIPDYVFGKNRDYFKKEIIHLLELLTSFKNHSHSLQLINLGIILNADQSVKEMISGIIRNHECYISLKDSIREIEERIDVHCIFPTGDKESRIRNLTLLEDQINLKRTIEAENIEIYILKFQEEMSWVSRTFKANISTSEATSVLLNYKSSITLFNSIKKAYSQFLTKIKQGCRDPQSLNTKVLSLHLQQLLKYSQIKKEMQNSKIFEFINDYQQQCSKFSLTFIEGFLDEDIASLYEEFINASQSPLKFLKYRSLKNKIDAKYVTKKGKSDAGRIKDLKFAANHQKFIQHADTIQKIKKFNEYLSLKKKVTLSFYENFIESECDSLLSGYNSIKLQYKNTLDNIRCCEKVIDSFYYSPIKNSAESRIRDLDRYIGHINTISDTKTHTYNQIWRRYLENQKIIDDTFHASVFVLEPSSLKEHYNAVYDQYQEEKKRQFDLISSLVQYDQNNIAVHYDTLLSDIMSSRLIYSIVEEIRSKNQFGREIFGEDWAEERTDVLKFEQAISINDWLVDKYLIGIFNQSHIMRLKEGISVSHIFLQTWSINDSDIHDCVKLIRDLIECKNSLSKKYISNILNEDFSKEEEQIKEFHIDIDRTVQENWNLWNCDTSDMCISYLKRIKKIQDLKRSVDTLIRESKVFSPFNFPKTPKSSLITDYLSWCQHTSKIVNDNQISQKTFEKILTPSNTQSLEEKIQQLSSKNMAFQDEIAQIFDILKINDCSPLYHSLETLPFNKISSQLKIWIDNIPNLDYWTNYQLHRNLTLNTIAGQIIPYLENYPLDQSLIIPLFEGVFSQEILYNVVKARPALSSFIADVHELKIEQFRETDEQFFDINKQYLKHQIVEHNHHLLKTPQSLSDMRIIREQLQKKKNRMSIRQLFERMGASITLLFPCVMMSPVTVAQFIPTQLQFDVIIFDEASQIPPAEAMGSILRGKQLIVIGDSQQLPPTNIFKGVIPNGDDGLGVAPVQNAEMESILSLCSIKSSFPKKSLMWHYRSKHESLIAVSNKLFYNRKLVIFPSPDFNSADLGLSHVILDKENCYYVPNGGANHGEAKIVTDMVVKHFTDHGTTKSLGIATFNINQKEAIEQELDKIRANTHPWLSEYLDSDQELFFVKNLESIQGDERDVIIVSVGFGFQKDGRLDLKFGPVIQAGGERRLNVLFTRAREQCIIVSNFTGNDLAAKTPTGIIKNVAINALVEYLHYAQYRELINKPPEPIFDSPFEESVYDFLRSEGFEVHTQVGCGRFRIDLAVLDPNTSSNRRYILGIECDGATYHSSQVARDRDRLRQAILEGDKKSNSGLGWKIHRIWSTDWWKHRDAVKVKLLQAVKAQMV